MKDWGCEAIFFFNYNRINMGIANDLVEPHMEALLGQERLQALRTGLRRMRPDEREARVRRSIGEALEEMGAPYLIPFLFRREAGRVSHYICFMTKNRRGYEIMKEIMASRGIVDEDGVPKFEYFPPVGGVQLSLDVERPYATLLLDLLRRFGGQTLPVLQIHDTHSVGTPFIKRNYKRAIMQLETAGRVQCRPPTADRRPGTLADNVLVTFP